MSKRKHTKAEINLANIIIFSSGKQSLVSYTLFIVFFFTFSIREGRWSSVVIKSNQAATTAESEKSGINWQVKEEKRKHIETYQ